jgi:hypothetical protein
MVISSAEPAARRLRAPRGFGLADFFSLPAGATERSFVRGAGGVVLSGCAARLIARS